jgi:hypothetical protein
VACWLADSLGPRMMLAYAAVVHKPNSQHHAVLWSCRTISCSIMELPHIRRQQDRFVLARSIYESSLRYPKFIVASRQGMHPETTGDGL